MRTKQKLITTLCAAILIFSGLVGVHYGHRASEREQYYAELNATSAQAELDLRLNAERLMWRACPDIPAVPLSETAKVSNRLETCIRRLDQGAR